MIINPMIFSSGGLTYESGTYTPSSHQTRPTISFSDSHSTPPFMVFMALNGDATSTESRPYTLAMWCYIDVISANSVGWAHYYYGTDNCMAAYVTGEYARANSQGQWANSTADTPIAVQYGPSNSTDTTNAYSRYFVTETGFRPSCTNSYTSQVAAGANYTWFAVWAPENAGNGGGGGGFGDGDLIEEPFD